MKTINTFNLPEEAKELDKKYADAYFKAILTTAPFLEQEVINPIKQALKRKTGYSNFNLPKETVVEQDFKVGNTSYAVKTIITDKKPSYSGLLTNLYEYMYFANELMEQGIPRVGMRNLNNQKSYLNAEVLVNIITGMKERITETGIKQEISHDALDKVPEKIVVPIVDYSGLPKEAEKLPEFEAFYDELVRRGVKSFENLLKKGVEKEEWKEMDNYLFHICTTPSQSTEYAKIYDALFFKKTEDSRKKCDEGELVLIANGRENSLKKSVTDTYDIFRPGAWGNYVSIKGISKRLEQLTKEYTKDKDSTKLLFYPFN
jgi:hypothetical protein